MVDQIEKPGDGTARVITNTTMPDKKRLIRTPRITKRGWEIILAAVLISVAALGAVYWATHRPEAPPKYVKTDDRTSDLRHNSSIETDDKKKVKGFTQLANENVNSGNFEQAIADAKQAYNTTPNGDTASLLGYVYFQASDYKSSVEWFKKAVSMVPKTGPDENSDYNVYLGMQKMAEEKL